MLQTDDTNVLRRKINDLPMPLFVADLRHDKSEFEFRALNRAHEKATGIKMYDVIDRPLSQVFDPAPAREANARFARCVQGDIPLMCRERLRTPSGVIEWDISLYAVDLPLRGKRVIGSAQGKPMPQRDTRDITALEDIDYFAASSEMRMHQLACVFAGMEQQIITPESLYSSANILMGLCNSVSETLGQMRVITTDRLTKPQQGRSSMLGRLSPMRSQPYAFDAVVTSMLPAQPQVELRTANQT